MMRGGILISSQRQGCTRYAGGATCSGCGTSGFTTWADHRQGRAWATAQGIERRAQLTPSAFQLAQFMEIVSSNGPTASVGAWHGLQAWGDKLGVPLPLSHAAVASFRFPLPGHQANQAEELEP